MKLQSTYKSRQHHLKNRMATALKALQNCARHPDRQNVDAPHFLAFRADFKLSDQNDALLGSVMMESMLGIAFSDAANDSASSQTDVNSLSFATTMDASDLADVMSEYSEETATDSKRGKGTKALYGDTKTSVIDFNLAKNHMRTKQLEAFKADLPHRQMIEREIAAIAQELDLDRKEQAFDFDMSA
jgi:hypothetical protein